MGEGLLSIYLPAGASEEEVLAYMHLQAQKYQGFFSLGIKSDYLYCMLGLFASPCAQTLLLITHYVGTYNILAFELISEPCFQVAIKKYKLYAILHNREICDETNWKNFVHTSKISLYPVYLYILATDLRYSYVRQDMETSLYLQA